VEFSLGCSGFVELSPGVLRLNLVTKFRFNDSVLKLLPVPEDAPMQALSKAAMGQSEPYEMKRYGVYCRKYIPWAFTRAIDETSVVWSLTVVARKSDVDLNCYERSEVYVTLTLTDFMRYYPFVLKVMAIRIVLDGTGPHGGCGRLNLLPRRSAIGAPADVDFDVFTAVTSSLQLADVKKDAAVMTMVRNQNVGGTKGAFTRIYAVCIFECSWYENVVKYAVVSSALMLFVPFSLNVENGINDTYGVGITLILTQAALLFILPETDELTTTERILVSQMLITIIMLLSLSFMEKNEDGVIPVHDAFIPCLCTVIGMSMIAVGWLVDAFFRNRAIKNRVREAMVSRDGYDVADFVHIERIV
jgi:hypothetical protein